MLEGILFDSDGVLVDSEKIYFKAVRDTFRNYGVEISQDEYVRRWMIEQTNSSGAIRDFKIQVSLDELRELKLKYIEEYMQELEIMPRVLDLLQRYHGKYPLGVVSSASRNEIQRNLGKFGLMKFFKVSVSGDDVTRTKPHPEPYQKGCELLGLNPQYALVIEDNPSGVKSAKDAGCKVVARPHGFTIGMDFSLADRVIKEFNEINDGMLMRLFSN